MSIDMTGLERLGSVGLDKLFTEVPRGQAKEGVSFAFKIKKVAWVEGKYGHRYECDVVIRTLDMQTVLASKLWKLYPSMLPQEVTEAIDTDTYDGDWYLVYTEVNPNSKATPPRTRLHLIDVQEGIDAQSGPSKPAAVDAPDHVREALTDSRRRGQPAPGEERMADATIASPGNPCLHENVHMVFEENGEGRHGFYCKDCGERVG